MKITRRELCVWFVGNVPVQLSHLIDKQGHIPRVPGFVQHPRRIPATLGRKPLPHDLQSPLVTHPLLNEGHHHLTEQIEILLLVLRLLKKHR